MVAAVAAKAKPKNQPMRFPPVLSTSLRKALVVLPSDWPTKLEWSMLPPERRKPRAHHDRALVAMSITFLIRIAWRFLDCTPPASSMAKPVCMKKTRMAQKKTKRLSTSAAAAAMLGYKY